MNKMKILDERGNLFTRVILLKTKKGGQEEAVLILLIHIRYTAY